MVESSPKNAPLFVYNRLKETKRVSDKEMLEFSKALRRHGLHKEFFGDAPKTTLITLDLHQTLARITSYETPESAQAVVEGRTLRDVGQSLTNCYLKTGQPVDEVVKDKTVSWFDPEAVRLLLMLLSDCGCDLHVMSRECPSVVARCTFMLRRATARHISAESQSHLSCKLFIMSAFAAKGYTHVIHIDDEAVNAFDVIPTHGIQFTSIRVKEREVREALFVALHQIMPSFPPLLQQICSWVYDNIRLHDFSQVRNCPHCGGFSLTIFDGACCTCLCNVHEPRPPSESTESSGSGVADDEVVEGMGKDKQQVVILDSIKQSENNLHVCCICQARPCDTMLLCSHAFCSDCISKIEFCPLCRAPKQKTFPVYP